MNPRTGHQLSIQPPLWFVVQAYVQLVRFDLFLGRRDFSKLYAKIRRCNCQGKMQGDDKIEQISSAVDFACIWYWKEVLCLQHSVAATCLLRRYGVPAELVIGAQQFPFKAHAWVEVEGKVVTDRPYVREIYEVLDRC